MADKKKMDKERDELRKNIERILGELNTKENILGFAMDAFLHHADECEDCQKRLFETSDRVTRMALVSMHVLLCAGVDLDSIPDIENTVKMAPIIALMSLGAESIHELTDMARSMQPSQGKDAADIWMNAFSGTRVIEE